MKTALKKVMRKCYLTIGRMTGLNGPSHEALLRAQEQRSAFESIVKEFIQDNRNRMNEILNAQLDLHGVSIRSAEQIYSHIMHQMGVGVDVLKSTDFQLLELIKSTSDLLSARITDLARRHDEEMDIAFRRFASLSRAATTLPPPLADRRTLSQCFEELQRRAPAAFRIWHPLLRVNEEAYSGFPAHSCSTNKQPTSLVFRKFLRKYLRGTVLDIGCGPQPVPSYLDGYPLELIAGVDPLTPPQPHPFAFAEAVAEFLPWADHTFDVVVIGTSLDHVLLLDVALREMKRVLKPCGSLVIWTSFMPEAKVYDPYHPDIRAVDDYHLFHFTRESFEKTIGEHFELNESVMVDGCSNFYTFSPRYD